MKAQLPKAAALLCLLLGGGYAFRLPSPPTVCRRRGGISSRADATSTSDTHHQLNALPSSSRREFVDFLASAAGAAAPVSLVAALPQPAFAEAPDVGIDYVGYYTDPKHPAGYRILVGDTKRASLRLQDDPSGDICNLPVRVDSSPDGSVVKQLSFDFSSKGGPADVTGVLSRDREGIPLVSFPDGNAWKKRETGPVGVYRDASNPGIFVAIRQCKGRELAVDLIRKEGETTMIKATGGSAAILFELSAGEAAVPGVFSAKKKTVSFEDGNVWTKF